MMDREQFRAAITGPLPSVGTPFCEDGSIDFAGLKKMADFYVENGAKTLLITPGDSLCSLMNREECVQVAKAVVDAVNHRACVIAAGWQWWQGEMLAFGEAVRDAGADVFVPYPANWAQSHNVEELKDYYNAAGKVMPYLLLSNLGGRGVPAGLVESLTENDPRCVGLKDDMPGPYGRDLAVKLNGRLPFMTGGTMAGHLACAPYGVDGYLAVFFRFAPIVDKMYWEKFQAGDIIGCGDIIKKYELPIWDLFDKLGMDFDAGLHGFMHLCGLCEPWRRRPYKRINAEQLDGLKAYLQEKGLL